MKSFFQFAEDFYIGVSDILGHYTGSICKLCGTVDDYIAVATNAALVSVIRIDGVLSHIEGSEFERLVNNVALEIANRLDSGGHMVQMLFGYDPDLVAEDLAEMDTAIIKSAANMGMDPEAVRAFMRDWRASIARYCAREYNYLAVWTSPNVLSPMSRRIMLKRMREEMLKTPLGKPIYAQRLHWLPKDILDTHKAFYNTLITNFRAMGILSDALPVRRWLHDYRRRIDPETTGPDCMPRLKWDRITPHVPDWLRPDRDYSDFLYPDIGSFLFPRETEDLSNNSFRIGNTLHGSFVMGLGPREVRPFKYLFRTLKDMRFPWHCCFLLGPLGLQAVEWKRIITSIFHVSWLFPSNAQFNNAYESLRNMSLEGDVIARVKLVFSTCVRGETDPKLAREKLVRQMHDLASAVQSWGGIETDMVVGNPVLALASSFPGVTQDIPSKPSAAPLINAEVTPVKMMPITRPASVWNSGSVIFRTPDGKVFPYSHLSAAQASWIDIGVAPMGQGKSVMLNTLNLGFCLQGGLTNLPFLSIIDIGPSSSGLINLLRAFLPEDKRHLAVYKRLRMDDRINPLDTPLGFRKPYPAHKTFLVNLLSLLATAINETEPQDGISGIARTCVDIAYDEYSDAKNPKPYVQGVNETVDELARQLNLHIDESTSWWEIVDAFMDKGYYKEAEIAQRYAVPLISEIAAIARRDVVSGLYRHKTPSDEPITDFFWRSLIDAIKMYPILSEPTSVDFGSARVISIDLDEVAPRGSPDADRQTGVMFMLARHLCVSRVFVMPDDVKFAPERWREYHKAQVEQIRSIPKRFSWDEMHRMKRDSALSKQLIADVETIVRESRKWNISVGLYSQGFRDFPPILIELATTFMILGTNTPAAARDIVSELGLPESMVEEILRLGKPDSRGANFVGVFKTAKGTICHVLTNTIGKLAVWAFSTTSEDMTVRNRLYEILGVEKALAALAHLYPGGIKAEIERRRLEYRRDYGALDDSANEDIFRQVIREILDEIRKLESKGVRFSFRDT